MTEEARTSTEVGAGVSTRPTSETPSADASDVVLPPPPRVPGTASGQAAAHGAPSAEESWFASSTPSVEPPRLLSSLPPAYNAEVAQARSRRKKVVLTAVCTLGGVVFALAAVRGIQRRMTAVAPPHAAIVVTTPVEPSAPSPSAVPPAAPSTSGQAREHTPAPARAERPATASTAKAPASGIAASPPRAKRTPSKTTNFEL